MAEEIKFEKAMERLAKIVEDLESGDVPLEDAIKKYEEGVRLARHCQDQLVKAEQKIEILTKTLAGNFETRPFDAEEGSEDASEKPSAKTKAPRGKIRPKTSGDEEILF